MEKIITLLYFCILKRYKVFFFHSCDTEIHSSRKHLILISLVWFLLLEKVLGVFKEFPFVLTYWHCVSDDRDGGLTTIKASSAVPLSQELFGRELMQWPLGMSSNDFTWNRLGIQCFQPWEKATDDVLYNLKFLFACAVGNFFFFFFFALTQILHAD